MSTRRLPTTAGSEAMKPTPAERAAIADDMIQGLVREMQEYRRDAKRPLVQWQKADMIKQAARCEAEIAAWRLWGWGDGPRPGKRYVLQGDRIVGVER